MYLYAPLNGDRKEIRVAILQPGQKEDPLRCNLQHTSLQDPASITPYETISYAWGDTTQRETIYMDDVEFGVTSSSASALRRMRRPDVARPLWIDAICINQDDDQERSSQVALMSEVFSLGTGNLVWLGSANESTEQAIESVGAILGSIAQETKDFGLFRETLYSSGGDALWKISTVSVEFNEKALRQLFSCTWFNRRWVVQEVTLPKNSMCYVGQFEIELNDLLRVAAWINHNYLTLAKLRWHRGIVAAGTMHRFADRTYGWYNIEEEPQVSITLDWLLTVLRDFDSTDSRDNIYGILGLYEKFIEAGESCPIVPDYELTHGEILTNVANYLFQAKDGLSLLNDVHHSLRNTARHRTVSWAPCFEPDDRPPFLTEYRATSGGPKLSPNHSITTEGKLSTQGYSLGLVSYRTNEMNKIWYDTTSSSLLLQEAIRLVQTFAKDVDHRKILGMVLCGGRCYDASLATESIAAETYEQFERRLLQHNELPPWPWELESLDPATFEGKQSQYKHETMHVCIDRRVFATETGHIGVASEILQPGDELALLAGCDWPVLVRPIGKNRDYEFIGTAYVYGAMFGEAMTKCLAEQKPLNTFDLV